MVPRILMFGRVCLRLRYCIVEENRPLNSIMESNAAYEEATAFIVEGAFERIEEWQALK